MQAIEIRPARPDDANVVADYHHRCFLKTYDAQLRAGEFTAPDPDGTLRQLSEWFGPGSDFETFVAIVDELPITDAPIGHFTIRDNQLVHLFVEPSRQGTGLGGYLLAQGEAMIAARGHDAFELHARVENVEAIAFYENAGWVVTDERIHTVEHGISYDEHVLVKRAIKQPR